MLDIKLLRQDLDAVVANLARRGFKLDRDRWLALEAQRKELQIEVERLRQTRNERSKSIGRAKAAGGDVEALKRDVGELGDALAGAEAKLSATSAELDDFLAGLPNMLHESVPPGRDSSDNVELRRWGTPPKFDFTPLDHVALGEKLGLMDFDAAAKLAGARFVVLRGAARAIATRAHAADARRADAGARLQRDVRSVSRQRPSLVRHGAAAEVRGRLVQGCQRRRRDAVRR